ncbi:hypothetical protein EIP91_007417 [Steccherinum ochraceum]|uniref:RING-type domain-containing protein n=1 Tax=Steccherinum ochraceum TaxID=92696 RepID=A0A4V2MXC2_9APHY|nr:hypothetical protein EIP91_007417 [Steccherinum ochraceum]
MRNLPVCGHGFCKECIDGTTAHNVKKGIRNPPCPNCRKPYTPSTVTGIHLELPPSYVDDLKAAQQKLDQYKEEAARYGSEVNQLKGDIERRKDEVTQFKGELEQFKGKLEQSKEELDQRNLTISRLESRHQEDLSAVAIREIRLADEQEKVGRLEEEKKVMQMTMEKVQQDATAFQEYMNNLIAARETIIRTKEGIIQGLQDKVEERECEILTLRTDVQTHVDKRAEQSQEIEQLNITIEQLRRDTATLTNEIQAHLTKLSEQRQEIGRLQHLDALAEEQERSIVSLQAELKTREDELAKSREEVAQRQWMKDKFDEQGREIAALRGEIQEHEHKLNQQRQEIKRQQCEIRGKSEMVRDQRLDLETQAGVIERQKMLVGSISVLAAPVVVRDIQARKPFASNEPFAHRDVAGALYARDFESEFQKRMTMTHRVTEPAMTYADDHGSLPVPRKSSRSRPKKPRKTPKVKKPRSKGGDDSGVGAEDNDDGDSIDVPAGAGGVQVPKYVVTPPE